MKILECLLKRKKHWAKFLHLPSKEAQQLSIEQELLQLAIDFLRAKIIDLQRQYKDNEKAIEELLTNEGWPQEQILRAKLDAKLFRTDQNLGQ